MQKNKAWIFNEISPQEVEKLASEMGISKLVAQVLLSRGICEKDKVKSFLYPDLEALHSPFLLQDMNRAVERIISALDKKEKIVIYGDYDVDGVTSTSVLFNFLTFLDALVDFYIPDRFLEGYGLSRAALERVLEMTPALIITVDCGITAFEEVAYMKGCGIEVIITDHHECQETLPDALAVINPCRHDSIYPFSELAGVGVAFKLIHALCLRLGLGKKYLDFLDLVTLGTVADVVNLKDENRSIVRHGLEAVMKTTNIGINALIDVAGLRDKPIDSYGIGFMMAPRINAAGRTGDAKRAVRLFTTSDLEEAKTIAEELNEANRFRQNTEAEILEQVLEKIEKQWNEKDESVIVVAGEDWHHGVIGIVASKITDRYYRPSVLISQEGDQGKGSGRSIEGFNLFKALHTCEHLLMKYGGHELAAGLTLKMAQFEDFKKAINAYAAKTINKEDLIAKVKIDAVIEKEVVTLENIRELELLAPFGAGNPGPRFACKDMQIQEIRAVGNEKHLKLKLQDQGVLFDAIGFNMGSLAKEYDQKDRVDAVFSLEINLWNSVEKPQFNLKDLKLNSQQVEENNYYMNLDKNIEFQGFNDYNIDNSHDYEVLVPDRPDLISVYQYFKAGCVEDELTADLFVLAKGIMRSYGVKMNYFKLKRCIEIFSELQLLRYEWQGVQCVHIWMPKHQGNKTKLEASFLYQRLQALKRKS